jgi:nucleotide-binding universal stress UspA family protein
LVTCTIASFAAQKGASKLALEESGGESIEEDKETGEKILIPVNYPENIEELVHLAVTIKTKSRKDALLALNIIPSDSEDPSKEKHARKILEKASISAAATDNNLTELIRYDSNVVNGITNVIKENKVTDIILGLHKEQEISGSFLGKLTEGILGKSNVTALIYQSVQPLSTISKYLIVVPNEAEKEMGFAFWLLRIWNIGRNTGAKLVFYASKDTLQYIQQVQKKFSVEAAFVEFSEWEDFLIISKDLKENDALIVVMSRKSGTSYEPYMEKLPKYLNKYFKQNNYVLIYPMQFNFDEKGYTSYGGTPLLKPLLSGVDSLENFTQLVGQLFKKK